MITKAKKFIKKEEKRQNGCLSLIASENYVSQNVLKALGSVFTNKYAEGYVGKRYYAGNELVDEVEGWVKDLGLKIFDLNSLEWSINVQPYSGSPANLAIYMAFLKSDDKVLSLSLSHGGHLTHGHKVSASSKFFNFVHYGVKQDGWLDYDEIEKIAMAEKPKLIVAGATAYAREWDFDRMGKIAHQAGGLLMADISHIAGLIAAGLHPTCFEAADVVMTTTHKTLRGPRGAVIYCRKKYQEAVDKAVFPGLQGGPHINNILAMGVAFEEVLSVDFKKYMANVKKNTKILAKELQNHGLKLVADGTDNHLLLIDLSVLGLGAKIVEQKLEEINIITNKNSIPYDTRKPTDPSGIRLGMAAATTRGITAQQTKKIAQIIAQVIWNISKEKNLTGLKKEVQIIIKTLKPIV
ncbi:MAG TPA: serine hydroxymethyltransferase [bacterium]|nr:serine hydroxymethyltransferase [bacterium]HPN67093.1 serine hydroxymethyltransferase [bacterium]